MKKILNTMYTWTILLLCIVIGMVFGHEAGMNHAIERMSIKQQGNFVICEIDGSPWKSILELEEW